MSRPDMQKAREGFAKVRAILHGDWDPIGCGVPEDEYDDYSPGRWAWWLTDIERFDPAIPARGAQGCWDWDPPVGG